MQPSDQLPLDVSCADLKSLLDADDELLLLDCRTPAEHDIVNLPQAKLLPMQELQDRLDEIESHRDHHIVVHCHHGGRSLMVTQWLREQGFANVQNLAGGIDTWAIEIEPGMTRY